MYSQSNNIAVLPGLQVLQVFYQHFYVYLFFFLNTVYVVTMHETSIRNVYKEVVMEYEIYFCTSPAIPFSFLFSLSLKLSGLFPDTEVV